MTDLTPAGALALRMRGLLLAGEARPKSVAEVVAWFGAMQAQDPGSFMWSLGVRLPGSTAADVRAALERGEAVRTWPMRGTVHCVPPRDARWMLDLMAGRTLAGGAARRAALGLTDELAERGTAVLAAALAGGRRLTRARCLAVLAEAGVAGEGQFGYHLLAYASQRGVTCIGPETDGEQTFVLLDEWAPDPHRPERDEALATIAVRYFRSHGPTTRQDFAGWTGLTAADARRAIAVAGQELATVRVDGAEMHLAATVLDGPTAETGGVWALPGFDEYLLGYKNRTLMLAPEHAKAVFPGGGMFRATLVRAGRVIGTWTRSQVRPLVRLGAADRVRVEEALAAYARFWE
jgi:winged helix DNA-binding protein